MRTPEVTFCDSVEFTVPSQALSKARMAIFITHGFKWFIDL
jgi:hypothetical protein